MISFNLRCDKDHEFEAWFASAEAFERATKAGANQCPVCGSAHIEKALMAPSVSTSKKRAGGDDAKKVKLAASDPRRKAMREALKDLRKKVTDNADYVGDKFAEEARKIHYEEVEPHGIYGEATTEDAKGLVEEGIEFHPLPDLPEDSN
jgi:hypothetical protein